PTTGITSDISLGSTGGNAGNIALEANSILIQDFGTFSTTIESITQGAGNAGNISLSTNGNLEITNAVLESDTRFGATGNGGNIAVTANGDIVLDGPGIQTISTTTGNAGSIAVTSTHGNISAFDFPSIASQSLKNVSAGNVGNITVSAPVGDISLTD